MSTVRPLLINTYDMRGGAARAAYRLHRGLRGIGVPSRMLVDTKASDDRTVLAPVTKAGKLAAYARAYFSALPVYRYKRWDRAIFSPALLPSGIVRRIRPLDADLFHLHWVAGGFIRIEELCEFKRPIVWTLHDAWAFSGGCHYPGDCLNYRDACGHCPSLGSERNRDLSSQVLRRKSRAWRNLDITIVSPSHWLADCARESALFRDREVKVIPNGIDVEVFKPIEKGLAREILGTPRRKQVILFGAMNAAGDRRKGLDLLLEALGYLAGRVDHDRVELWVIGASSGPDNELFPVRYLGQLHDDISLSVIYSAADVFVAPSRQENLSNTVMEAMACGAPCVVFDIGGMPDLIGHRASGYLARPFDANDLSEGIGWVLGDEGRWWELSMAARKKVETEYALGSIARRHLALYEEVLGRTAGRSRNE